MSSRHQYLASDQLSVTEIDDSSAKIAFQMDATTYIAVRVCQHMGEALYGGMPLLTL